MATSLWLLVLFLVVAIAGLLWDRKPAPSKRAIACKDERTLHRASVFTIKEVEKERRMSLDWDGSEETREEFLEDVYIVTAEYGLQGQGMESIRLWVGDSIEVILEADIVLSTLEED